MDFHAIQTRRRLEGTLQRKKEEAARRKREAARKAEERAQAEAEKKRRDAVQQKKNRIEKLLQLCEQGIRSFGIVPGVPTSKLRKWFEANFSGMKLDNELFRQALKKGIDEKRLKIGKRNGKPDINCYLINGQEEPTSSALDDLASTLSEFGQVGKQKRFVQPLIFGLWFIVWASMELNQDFRLVQQLMFEFDDPYEYEMQFIGGGTCSVTDELDDVPAIVNATSATKCTELCLVTDNCFAADYDISCNLYAETSSGVLPLSGGAGCYNKVAIGGGPNRVVADSSLLATLQYTNWTCIDKFAVEDEDGDGIAELYSYHAHCLSIDPMWLGNSSSKVSVPYLKKGDLLSHIDAETCSMQTTFVDPADAADLSNVSIGEAIWGRKQEAAETYLKGQETYCGSKNTEFLCLLNITTQGARYPCQWNSISRVCQPDVDRINYESRAQEYCSASDGDQESCTLDVFSCDWQGCFSGPTCEARLIAKDYPDDYANYFELTPELGNCSIGTHQRDFFDNATSYLQEPRIWWAMLNASRNSIDRRILWTDAFGEPHLSIGSPCDVWYGDDPCTVETCTCDDEFLDDTLTLDLQLCNISGTLFELEAATALTTTNIAVVALLVFIGGWVAKIIALVQAPEEAKDAVTRAQLAAVKRGDDIMSASVRIYVLTAVVRICCYTLVSNSLACFGLSSTSATQNFAPVWTLQWWIVPVFSWGGSTFPQQVNAQIALLFYNWFRQSLFDLLNSGSGRAAFELRLPTKQKILYYATVSGMWIVLCTMPLVAVKLLSISHLQYLESLSQFFTVTSGQFDVITSMQAAHFAGLSMFCGVTLSNAVWYVRRYLASSLAAGGAATGSTKVLPVPARARTTHDVSTHRMTPADAEQKLSPSASPSQRWCTIQQGVMNNDTTSAESSDDEDARELKAVEAKNDRDRANLKGFRMSTYSFFAGSYHTVDSLGSLQVGQLCQQVFFFGWLSGAIAAALVLLTVITFFVDAFGRDGEGAYCVENVGLFSLALLFDLILLGVGVWLNMDCCRSFKELPFVNKKHEAKVLKVRLQALMKLKALSRAQREAEQGRAPDAARLAEDDEIQRRREEQERQSGARTFTIPLSKLGPNYHM